MSRHHVDERVWRRRTRIVRLAGKLHFFRVNVPDLATAPWYVND